MALVNPEKILDLIKTKSLKHLQQELLDQNEVDVAHLMEELHGEDVITLFRALHKDTAAEVFSHLTSDMQEHVVASITDQEVAGIINELYVDDAADFLEELPANVVKRVLKNARPEVRDIINQFLQYPADSAGSIMTAEFVDLKKSMTVLEAFARIRQTAVDRETIYTCYVLDANRRLEGILSVKDLFLANDDQVLEDIMDTNIIYSHTIDDQEAVAHLFAKYDLISMPIVDHENRLVGIVTVDDVVEVMTQEVTEDFQKMAATQPSERPYLRTGVFELAKNRITWLLLLLVTAMITGSILQHYEDALLAIPLLISFIPMLMDTGGNAGSQSATLIIRGIAISEIGIKDLGKVVWKEFRVSVLVGVVLGFLNFIRIFIMHPDIMLALTVSLSLMGIIVIAKTIGASLPLLARLAKLDPALMAAPIITTVVDAVGLILYFFIVESLLLS